MECLRCGNKDPAYFYKGHRGYYCRKCVSFSRVLLEEELEKVDYEIAIGADEYHFAYQLTHEQSKASKECLLSLKDSDVLLYCVCGAGKTEIVVESISSYLAKGLKVAYAISRKEVVIELEKRFKEIFHNAKVIGVYGGHHDELVGDLIVCTTHQLYRYHDCFDLLILDEVDAFPLKGNATLMNIALRSSQGRIIFSTATINDDLKKILKRRVYKKVELYVRPSHQPLIVPSVIYLPRLAIYLALARIMRQTTNQCIIFVYRKKECAFLYRLFSHFFSCTYVYSDLDKREENIRAFRDKKYAFIFSTTVLERGITIKDIDVIIVDNARNCFDEGNLIQMLGRVGRNIDNPFGKAYILSNHHDRNIDSCIKRLEEANSYL